MNSRRRSTTALAGAVVILSLVSLLSISLKLVQYIELDAVSNEFQLQERDYTAANLEKLFNSDLFGHVLFQ